MTEKMGFFDHFASFFTFSFPDLSPNGILRERGRKGKGERPGNVGSFGSLVRANQRTERTNEPNLFHTYSLFNSMAIYYSSWG